MGEFESQILIFSSAMLSSEFQVSVSSIARDLRATWAPTSRMMMRCRLWSWRGTLWSCNHSGFELSTFTGF